jgi:hypothetical protein
MTKPIQKETNVASTSQLSRRSVLAFGAAAMGAALTPWAANGQSNLVRFILPNAAG